MLTLEKLKKLIPDADAGRLYLESMRWSDGIRCAKCGSRRFYPRHGERKGYYVCLDCRAEISVQTNTIFHYSNLPHHKLIYCLYLLKRTNWRMSAIEMSKRAGVNRLSCFRLLDKLGLQMARRQPLYRAGKALVRPYPLVDTSIESLDNYLAELLRRNPDE